MIINSAVSARSRRTTPIDALRRNLGRARREGPAGQYAQVRDPEHVVLDELSRRAAADHGVREAAHALLDREVLVEAGPAQVTLDEDDLFAGERPRPRARLTATVVLPSPSTELGDDQ